MTDAELGAIADARREVDAARRRLLPVLSWLEGSAAAKREHGLISEALDTLRDVSDALYKKEHGH